MSFVEHLFLSTKDLDYFPQGELSASLGSAEGRQEEVRRARFLLGLLVGAPSDRMDVFSCHGMYCIR